jgi:hypothetical protein
LGISLSTAISLNIGVEEFPAYLPANTMAVNPDLLGYYLFDTSTDAASFSDYIVHYNLLVTNPLTL